jgi:flagellar basal body rod protein FlgF
VIRTRRTRDTGELLTVCRPADVDMDPDGGGWMTICEDHGTLSYSRTQQLALDTRGMDFCDDCRELDAQARQRLGVL